MENNKKEKSQNLEEVAKDNPDFINYKNTWIEWGYCDGLVVYH